MINARFNRFFEKRFFLWLNGHTALLGAIILTLTTCAAFDKKEVLVLARQGALFSYLHLPLVKPVKIKENSLFAKLAARQLKSDNVAMVIGSTIHLFGVGREDFLSSTRWVRHELKHVEQAKRLGLLRFLLLYLWESLRHGYHQNKYEVEARAAEEDEEIASRFYISSGIDQDHLT